MKYLLLPFFLLISQCNQASDDPVLYGYVEGNLAHIAPIPPGRILQVHVREGQSVSPGQVLFRLDPAKAETVLSNAVSAQNAAKSHLSDLKKAGRPDEIRAAEQALAQRKAALQLAEQSFARSNELVRQKLAPTARLDAARAALFGAKAAAEEAKAKLSLRKSPAREDQIAAARADVLGRAAQTQRAKLDLAEYEVLAVTSGTIQNIYRRPGELAGPAQPVLALLSPDQMRIRIFVPEPRLAEISGEMRVQVSCDGCPANLHGKIAYISKKPEFTPPVIFTQKERAKLVWMVEIIPDDPSQFRLGQPVEIRW